MFACCRAHGNFRAFRAIVHVEREKRVSRPRQTSLCMAPAAHSLWTRSAVLLIRRSKRFILLSFPTPPVCVCPCVPLRSADSQGEYKPAKVENFSLRLIHCARLMQNVCLSLSLFHSLRILHACTVGGDMSVLPSQHGYFFFCIFFHFSLFCYLAR